MRVVWLWAVLAGLLAALTGPPVTGDPRRSVDAVIREHPEIWAGARVVQGDRSIVIGSRDATDAAVAADTADTTDTTNRDTRDTRDTTDTTDAAVTAGAARTPGSGSPGLADLARRADRASLIVARVAGPVRPLILVPATTEQAATLAAPAAVNGLAAVAGTDRVIIEPRSFARLTGAGRDVVLAHELTHVATGAATDGRTPKWLMEGFADYVGYLQAGIPVASAAAELAAEVRAGRLPAALPGADAFSAGSARLAQAYEEAWLACRYVAGRFGERALVTLYRESMRSGPRTALRRTLGMTTARFTAAWREYVRSELS
ncbi:hypothetical protein GCM10022226_22430 [Sphaerisporangium flaviroseum]|uniref:Peptidase n=1 Tax=Sphaerisporangium flaviroseum TaxID=509199 RepID=A0ABP7HR30_9ACTN